MFEYASETLAARIKLLPGVYDVTYGDRYAYEGGASRTVTLDLAAGHVYRPNAEYSGRWSRGAGSISLWFEGLSTDRIIDPARNYHCCSVSLRPKWAKGMW